MAPKLVNGQVGYLEIPAVDIQRSTDFYVKVFGWRITKRLDGSTAFEDRRSAASTTPPEMSSDYFRLLMSEREI